MASHTRAQIRTSGDPSCSLVCKSLLCMPWHSLLATAVIVVASFTVLVALILAGVIPVPDTGSHQRVGRFFQVCVMRVCKELFTLKFKISDVHLDPLYSVTGNLSTHCRAVAIPGYTLELPPELTSLKPSPFGQYGALPSSFNYLNRLIGCDPPELLVNATYVFFFTPRVIQNHYLGWTRCAQ